MSRSFLIIILGIYISGCTYSRKGDIYTYIRACTEEKIVDKYLNKNDLKWISKADTLILFYAFDIQTGKCYGSIWSNQINVNYQFVLENSEKEVEPSIYSDFIITNILKKDTLKIRLKEEEQKPLLGGSLVTSTLFVKKEKVYTFEFNEFFDSLRPVH